MLSIQDGINVGKETGVDRVGTFPTWGSRQGSAMPDAGMTAFTTFLQACAGYAPDSITHGSNGWAYNKSYVGNGWNQGEFGYTLGSTLLPPNPNYPNCNLERWGGDMDGAGMWNLSSYHPGGANIAMADGSVHFLKSTVSWNILWALGSRAGGEVISSGSY
jgi:prepilin-type processing-associated H-X9-DG protein